MYITFLSMSLLWQLFTWKENASCRNFSSQYKILNVQMSWSRQYHLQYLYRKITITIRTVIQKSRHRSLLLLRCWLILTTIIIKRLNLFKNTFCAACSKSTIYHTHTLHEQENKYNTEVLYLPSTGQAFIDSVPAINSY